MNRIEWSESALQDLREIHAYIARDSIHYAQRLVDRIRVSIEITRRFPAAAARVPEWDRDDVREVFVGQYRVIYKFSDDAMQVLAVIHAARQLPQSDID
jgi:plasmid stabilization system protein ParE